MIFFARASSVSEPPWTRARRARIAAISPRKEARSTPRRRRVSAGMRSSGSTRAASRCSASSTGLCNRSASCWAATMASWAFSVKRSSCMGRVSGGPGSGGPGVWLVDEVEERPGGGGRRLVEGGREHDADLHVQVASTLVLHLRHALALEADRPPGLGPRRDREQDPALERGERDLRAQESFLEGDLELPFQVGA